MPQLKFTTDQTFRLTTGNIISILGGLKIGNLVKIKNPITQKFMALSSGSFVLSSGELLRTDMNGVIIDIRQAQKAIGSPNPTPGFASVAAPIGFMAFSKQDKKEPIDSRKAYFTKKITEAKVQSGGKTLKFDPEFLIGAKASYIHEITGQELPIGKQKYLLSNNKVVTTDQNSTITAIEPADKLLLPDPDKLTITLRDGRLVEIIGGKLKPGATVLYNSVPLGGPAGEELELTSGKMMVVKPGGVIDSIREKNAPPKPAAKEPSKYSVAFSSIRTEKQKAGERLIEHFKKHKSK